MQLMRSKIGRMRKRIPTKGRKGNIKQRQRGGSNNTKAVDNAPRTLIILYLLYKYIYIYLLKAFC